MKIRIAAYKEGVAEPLKYESTAEELDVKFDDMKFLTPVEVDGIVEREKKSLRFSGKVKAKVIRVCGRTLAEVEDTWTSNFDWFFETENLEFVSPDEQLRELVILDHPMVYRAPGADKPAEYEDKIEKKSPFETLKQLKSKASGQEQKSKKKK